MSQPTNISLVPSTAPVQTGYATPEEFRRDLEAARLNDGRGEAAERLTSKLSGGTPPAAPSQPPAAPYADKAEFCRLHAAAMLGPGSPAYTEHFRRLAATSNDLLTSWGNDFR